MTIRVLVVDDYKDWRDQVRSLLRARAEWQVICEVSDGLEVVQKAEELKTGRNFARHWTARTKWN